MKKVKTENDAEEFARHMVAIAGPRAANELVVHGVYRAADALGLSRRQGLAYWYRARKIVPYQLMDKARQLASMRPPEGMTEAEWRRQIIELRIRVERVEAACRARGIILDQ